MNPASLLSVRRGRAPNCSATGAIVGAALVTAVAAAVIANAFADRFARWRDAGGGHGDGGDGGPNGEGTDGRRADGSASGRPERALAGRVRIRAERFGALVALDGRAHADGNDAQAAILAVGPDEARAALAAGAVPIGVPCPAPPDGALAAPIEVHVAVTDRCGAGCATCYLDAERPGAGDPSPAPLDPDLDALAALGVFEIALGGGEAVSRDELVGIARGIRARGMVPNLTTSGVGLTARIADQMAGVVGQVNVSIDGLADTYRAVRGWHGADIAWAAIDRLVAAGVRVGANTVITRANVGELEALGEALAERGVAEWQWLRLKPSGRARAGYAERALTADERRSLWPRTLAIEARTGLALRWDCAMVPFLAEHDVPVEALRTLAVTGCPGGASLLSRGADGRWSPCSFAADAAATGSAGEVWRDEAGAIAAWRAYAAAPAEPCRSCPYAEVCRGGCRIVAGHHGSALAPDPECARVVARAARAEEAAWPCA